MDRQDRKDFVHTQQQAIFSPSSVVHYRPPLLCRPWAGQRPQPAKYTHIYTHMQTVATLTFLDHETRLDFQYGFVFQPSAPSFLPFCILPPVGVNVIKLVCLLPACCFLLSVFLSAFFFFCPTLSSAHLPLHAVEAEVMPRWASFLWTSAVC